MRFFTTLVVLAGLTLPSTAAAVGDSAVLAEDPAAFLEDPATAWGDPCGNGCKPNGSKMCASRPGGQWGYWVCEKDCWHLKRVCKNCVKDPEPHCKKN